MSDYEDLVELGFEGLDKFANKYHDKVYGFTGHRRHSWAGGKKKGEDKPREQPRELPDAPEELHKSKSNDESRTMYAPDRRKEQSWADEDRGGYSTLGRGEDRASYVPDRDCAAVRRRNVDGYYGGYDIAPSPPYGYAPRPAMAPAYDRGGFEYERGRGAPLQRRPSSYSPPRRGERRSDRRHDSPHRRARSRSPSHNRVAATVLGALAGGLVGNAAKPNSTWTTVAGAVVGGVGAREAEKIYDRRQDRKMEDDEREERRVRRRRERDQWG